MIENRAVWGIEIGQAALKAIRLRYVASAGQVVADAFDFIPHPKILSQPDAIPAELIPQAMETFLSRNDLRGSVVCMSLPGQTALARFIQLPPVESSKVAEIVKYEAKQQIPFALEDVIWDYQPLGSGMEESGFMIDAEVGLFAMKREQVMQHMKPFFDAKVEVDIVQISPLAMHNFVCYDRLGIRPDEEFDATDQYTIVLDMGADNTTLLVTNGAKIWIRNVPLGGNHFTRALTKEMKLTFAKAEHLKCNATKSPDPRAVFQALRPVFNDYVSEIQRSIGYFSSVNREAKITKVVGVGNGFKLAGLQKFLQQNLQYEVDRVDHFPSLAGDSVVEAALFQENIQGFVVPYGLALQGLGLGDVRTTLLPPEIATARKIRRKKPWALTAAAALMLGLSLSTVGYSFTASSTSTARFGEAEKKVTDLKGQLDSGKSAYDAAVTQNKALIEEGKKLVVHLDRRTDWLDVYKAIDESLPRDIGDQKDIADIGLKNRISIRSVTAQKVPDLGAWYSGLPDVAKTYISVDQAGQPPAGSGYVFTMEGVHYHHDPLDANLQGVLYVKNTFLKNLSQPIVQQADSPAPVPVGEIGISHPTIVRSTNVERIDYYPDGLPSESGTTDLVATQVKSRTGRPRGTTPPPRVSGEPAKEAYNVRVLKIFKTTFTIQFAWNPNPQGAAAPPAGANAGAPPAGGDPGAMPPGGMPPGGMPGDPGAMPPGGIPGDPGAMPPGGIPGDPGAMPPGGIPGDPGAMPPGGVPGDPGAMPPGGIPGTPPPGAFPPGTPGDPTTPPPGVPTIDPTLPPGAPPG